MFTKPVFKLILVLLFLLIVKKIPLMSFFKNFMYVFFLDFWRNRRQKISWWWVKTHCSICGGTRKGQPYWAPWHRCTVRRHLLTRRLWQITRFSKRTNSSCLPVALIWGVFLRWVQVQHLIQEINNSIKRIRLSVSINEINIIFNFINMILTQMGFWNAI